MKTNSEELTVQKHEDNGHIVLADLNSGTLPDLSSAEAYPFDLMADYWTPEDKNEHKNLFFDKIATRTVADQATGEMLDLECAFFFEQVNGEVKSISNGSKRLVGALQANQIQRGTPLQIIYLGKKKNKNNSFLSDNWSVKILRLAI